MSLLGTCVRGLLSLVGSVPPRRALALGSMLGRAHARAGSFRVRDARRNIALAFPDMGEAERESILVESFASLGRALADVALLGGRHRAQLLAGLRIEGRANLEEALEAGRGAFIATAHLGSWELAGVALAQAGWPLVAVQHETEPEWLAEIVESWRVSGGMELATLGHAGRDVLRALDRGKVVALLLDQNADRESGVFAPFFGEPACTRAGAVRLAMRRGIPILPAFCVRVSQGLEHEIRIEPPLELGRSLEGNVARVNAAIEAAIRRSPEQWLWAHRRFRTRPEGAPRIYPSRRAHRVRRATRSAEPPTDR